MCIRDRQKIDDLIHIEKGIQQRVVVADQRPDIVRQPPMKAHMAKAEFIVATPELLTPVGAQRHQRVVAADGVLPKLGAVSYTHLDVYKRQGSTQSAATMR